MDPSVVVSDRVPDSKQALRLAMRAARRALDPAVAGAGATRLATLLDGACSRLGTLAASGVGPALLYAALPGEPDTLPLDGRLRQRGLQVAYPRVAGDHLALHLASPSELVPAAGRMPLLQPTSEAPRVLPASLSLVIVPGLAFSPSGVRLGFGGGYYDRLLPRCAGAMVIGVCFDVQIVESLPSEPHDHPVDGLAVIDSRAGSVRLLPTHSRPLPVAGFFDRPKESP